MRSAEKVANVSLALLEAQAHAAKCIDEHRMAEVEAKKEREAYEKATGLHLQRTPEELLPGLDLLQNHADLIQTREWLASQLKDFTEKVRQVACPSPEPGEGGLPPDGTQPETFDMEGAGGDGEIDEGMEDDDGGPSKRLRAPPSERGAVTQSAWPSPPSSTARSSSAPPSSTTPARTALLEQTRKEAWERARKDADRIAASRPAPTPSA